MSNSINSPRPDPGATSHGGLVSVTGYPSVAHRLTSIVVHPVLSAWAGTPGVVAPSGALLYGPPGEAIATLVGAVATDLGVDHELVDSRASAVPLLMGPSVIQLEHLDDGATAPSGRPSLAADLFDEMGRLPPERRPFVLATSVAPWNLDPALFAVGRLDRLAFVPPPGWEARSSALQTGGARRGLDIGTRIPLLAAATVGWSGADLDELLDQLMGEVLGVDSEVGQPSLLLDVVSRIVPRTRSWIGRARDLVESGTANGLVDDLIAWLQRAPT